MNAYGAYGNGYNTYKQVSVKTASQGKLLVMLYEAAVSNLEDSLALIEADGRILPKNIEAFGNHIQKTMDIITELQVSLDMDRGGEIAKNLMSLYVYFNKELLDSTISHDKSKITFVHNMLSDLHQSWKVAASSTANSQVTAGTQTSFSISG